MMSTDGTVEFDWGDGPHRFRLGIKEARELEAKRDCGLYRLMHRIASGDWRVDDLRETIRIGMIGGGGSPEAVLNLIKRYFDEEPVAKQMEPALRILKAFSFGPDDEQVGKHAGNPEGEAEKTTTAASTSPSSSH